MLSKTLFKAFNEQVNAEMYSAYLYLAMSAYAEDAGFKGAANWLYAQTQEEMAHAIHMYQYILDRGEAPALLAIEQPPATYNGLNDLFGKVYEHELTVTASINKIASLAMQEGDHASYQFIMWYVSEQVEEEASAQDVLSKLKLIGDNTEYLLNLDNELAMRVFNNPFPNDPKLGGA